MPAAVLDAMKRYVAFGDRDEANVRALADVVQPHLGRIVDRFYHEVQAHAETRAVLTGGATQVEDLRQSLRAWLIRLFQGRYEEDYARERAQIGRVHVHVGLPQHFMVVAMQVIWEEVEAVVTAAKIRRKSEKLASLHKLLMIENGLILSSYQEHFVVQVRQVERDAVQSRLREAEQLAQIGQLAASLAHEIKNPLAGISGAIQVIRANLKQSDPHWPVLGEVLRQINRLDRSVKDLLVYARPKPPRYQRCDLRRAIERVLNLLRKEPEFERIRLEYSVARNLPVIAADEHQLEQVLMNLLLNAAQASQSGGVVRLSAAAGDGRVQLVVEDRGCGMSLEVSRRALEPFFTTKSRGTGLGLPICRKIVEAHGGSLSIRSAPGEGTEVTVELHEEPPTVAVGADDEDSRTDR